MFGIPTSCRTFWFLRLLQREVGTQETTWNPGKAPDQLWVFLNLWGWAIQVAGCDKICPIPRLLVAGSPGGQDSACRLIYLRRVAFWRPEKNFAVSFKSGGRFIETLL